MKHSFLFLQGVGFQELLLLLLFPVFVFLIFLAIRSILLWYWKINNIENLLKEQNAILRAIHDHNVKQSKTTESKL
jgi:hypothetical protein